MPVELLDGLAGTIDLTAGAATPAGGGTDGIAGPGAAPIPGLAGREFGVCDANLGYRCVTLFATAETSAVNLTRRFYDDSYQAGGAASQRRYPNEEMLRFLAGYRAGLDSVGTAAPRALELGCGSGANLWAIAKEGFEAHGVDLSPPGLQVCGEILKGWAQSAALVSADMTQLPYVSSTFDVAIDVFSTYCLNEDGFRRCLFEVGRVLRPGGQFFSFHPSKASDAFKNHLPAAMLDASTLSGIHRETSPYYGNFYPFRFINLEEFKHVLQLVGLEFIRGETVGRTYRGGIEYFEFLSVVAGKPL